MPCTNQNFLLISNYQPMTTQERIEKIESELSELKALALKEKEEKEFKVGDWVIIIDYSADTSCPTHVNGDTGIIKSINKVDAKVEVAGKGTANYGDYKGSSFGKRFRKATPEEIEKHLIEQAEKKGFVKGASVVSIAHGGSASIIGNVFLYRDVTKFFPNASTSYYGEDKQYAICVNYSCHRGWDFLDKIKLLPSTPQIEINGYKAEFKEWGISFNGGCAKISKEVFIQLAKSCNGAINDDNRTLESVKIGKGEFTRDQIKEIATHFTK
jgi:hypothetical protein